MGFQSSTLSQQPNSVGNYGRWAWSKFLAEVKIIPNNQQHYLHRKKQFNIWPSDIKQKESVIAYYLFSFDVIKVSWLKLFTNKTKYWIKILKTPKRNKCIEITKKQIKITSCLRINGIYPCDTIWLKELWEKHFLKNNELQT